MQDSLTIKSVSWRNFRSYGNNTTQLSFGKPGVTAITGKIIDKTTHGNTNNGVGKSTIAEALTWCLFDKSIAGVKVDELINNVNQKNMEVTVEFEKGGNHYLVSRYRKLGKSKSNGVKLLVNDVDKTLDSVSNTNLELERIIGVPYDTFVLIVVITASKDSFLDRPVKSSSGANQTDFFEWMFNLSLLTDKAEVLKEQLKATNDKLKEFHTKVEYQQQAQARYQRSIDQASKRVTDWEASNEVAIAEAEESLEHLSSIDAEEQQMLLEMKATVKERVDTISSSVTELTVSIKSANQVIKKANSELEHLADQKCPYCLQKYESAEAKIEQLKEAVSTNQAMVEDEQPQLDVLAKQLVKQKAKLSEITGAIVIDGKRLAKLTEDIAVLKSKIETLKTATNPMVAVYDDLIANPPEEEGEIDMTEINELDKLAKHQEFLYKLLTKKDSFIRKNLLAKAVPFLNTRLQHYLSNLDAEYKVEFDLELNAKITAFGKEMSYRSLSNGQKAKINIVIPFAFRDVLQSMYGRVNICICDEVLDFGLDETGVALAAGMIRTIAKEQNTSVYVISHKAAASEGFFDNQILIEMEKRFSNIVHQ